MKKEYTKLEKGSGLSTWGKILTGLVASTVLFSAVAFILGSINLSTLVKYDSYRCDDCDDGNQCTADLCMPHGDCLHTLERSTKECTTACYKSGTGNCNTLGVCKGDVCSGTCAVDEDCPTIETTTGTLSGNCLFGGSAPGECRYTAVIGVGESFCTKESSDKDCASILDLASNYTSCLVPSSSCEVGEGLLINCRFYFACSWPFLLED